MSEELWLPVPGYGGHYEASSLGNIRVKDRVVTKPHSRTRKLIECHYKGHLLSGNSRGPSGHRCVTITANGKESTVFVHKLVLLAFVGPRPEGMEACHNNGDAIDNRPENLRWDTHLANNRDRLRHGTYLRGESHHMATVTEEAIRSVRARGLGYREIAAELGVSISQAHRIFKGTSWAHVRGVTA